MSSFPEIRGTVRCLALALGVASLPALAGAQTQEFLVDADHSTVRVTIDAATVDTGNDGRDEHLRSADFFDVERFPTITFASERIVREGDAFVVRGPLTIRDVTRTVEFRLRRTHAEPVVEAFGVPSIAFEGSLELDRKAFGVAGNARWNRPILSTGELAMSDAVGIQLRIVAQETGAGR